MLEIICPRVSVLGLEKLHQGFPGRWEWKGMARCEGQSDKA